MTSHQRDQVGFKWDSSVKGVREWWLGTGATKLHRLPSRTLSYARFRFLPLSELFGSRRRHNTADPVHFDAGGQVRGAAGPHGVQHGHRRSRGGHCDRGSSRRRELFSIVSLAFPDGSLTPEITPCNDLRREFRSQRSATKNTDNTVSQQLTLHASSAQLRRWWWWRRRRAGVSTRYSTIQWYTMLREHVNTCPTRLGHLHENRSCRRAQYKDLGWLIFAVVVTVQYHSKLRSPVPSLAR